MHTIFNLRYAKHRFYLNRNKCTLTSYFPLRDTDSLFDEPFKGPVDYTGFYPVVLTENRSHHTLLWNSLKKK